MTTYAVLLPLAIMAKDVDSLNRYAKSAADLSNGNVVQLASKSTVAGEGEVWVATTPATSFLNNLWMVYEPEIVTIFGPDGTEYKGINSDPRNFLVKAGKVFSAFKPQAGDVIRVTADALTGTKSTNTFINAADSTVLLTWGATQTASALSFKLVGTDPSYISIGNNSAVGVIGGTGRVTAYEFACVAN